MPLGLYLHIPFCSAICNYCNFNRGLFDQSLKTRYVAALIEEIRRATPSAADTIYFGGGTPSLLDADEVALVIAACRTTFAMPDDTEVTLEANPDTVTFEKLDGFRAAGVNRISFGVQSFRDDELTKLSRLHDAERARHAYAWAREAGFENISLDLMLWLPGQTHAHAMQSVEGLIDLSPDHASLYLLELYPNAPLRGVMQQNGEKLASEDEAAGMYEAAMSRLEQAGYRQYEISNVARPVRRSRHNLKYWSDGEWLGFGCGAHSTRGGVRWKNVSATDDYVRRISSGDEVISERRELTPTARMEEALFMGLRLSDGVDLAAIDERYGVDTWKRYGAALEPHMAAGLVHKEGSRVRLTRQGMLLSHEVMTVFV
ncbi:MAG TPA: radical SAM family heme chaperone HemW [Vicinamibacterales bacterium]|jgi:oxygen-independent coproporphyrinogen-3 oxidase